jgi:ABC-type enterochelin transport system permease subunit
MSVIVVSIRKSRTITWNGFLPPIGLVVPNGIGITIVVTYTSSGTPTLIGKFPFRTTER